jgi:phospho-N-acetylmuramoyl-pentapeptide-transferase
LLFSIYHKLHLPLVPFVFSFIATALVLPFYINWLKQVQINQFVREEGPASHASKNKTPTTGGVVFALSSLVGYFLYSAAESSLQISPLPGATDRTIGITLLALFCGMLGASDDLSKVTQKNNRGLTPRFRLITEILLGLLFGFVIFKTGACNGLWLVPAHKFIILPSWLIIGLSIFVVTACTNAVNLHDGMDGLAAGTTALVFITLACMLSPLKDYNLAAFALSCAGSLFAFLLFNRYPAKIFMGDTGSLFLGGSLAAIVLASGLALWFIPLALIYILETLSVIAQVSYFKLTKPVAGSIIFKLTHKLPGEGKRLFRMAPLHHHFEAVFADKGIPEWQVVLGFWLVQFLLCVLVLAVFLAF